MKTNFLAVALVVSAAFVGNAQAHQGGGGGGQGGGGGGRGGGGGGRGGGSSSFSSMPMRGYAGRFAYPGHSYFGNRSMMYRQPYVYSGRPSFSNSRQFASRSLNSANHFATSRNNSRLSQNASRFTSNGNTLAPNWRNHVVAQHSANWHRDWDRDHDHFFHGHRCCFFNGSWFVFDVGFYPWWPWWWDWYPYDYYGYGYYGYPYDYGLAPDAYQDPSAYARNDNGNQYTDSTVAAVQDRLARDGYYHGQIDGVAGRQTRRAIARFQSNHRLPVTGQLTSETLEALRMRSAANY